MPRGKLNERTVQHIALQWLETEIAARPSIVAATSKLEANVAAKAKRGHGRADGLVAALTDQDAVYTASLEAKSHRTLNDISPQDRDGKLFIYAGAPGLAIGLVVAYGLLQTPWAMWKWAIPLITFFLAALIAAVIIYDQPRFRRLSVLQQALHYPADEQWIALSSDAWNKLTPEARRAFQKDCTHHGVGLLRVNGWTQVYPMLRPQRRPASNQSHGYLSDYAACARLYHQLRTQAAATPTDQTALISHSREAHP